MDKTQLINSCCDLFGYSSDDFEEMTYSEIWDYLSKSQQKKVAEYIK